MPGAPQLIGEASKGQQTEETSQTREENRVETTREVNREKDRYEKQKRSVEDRKSRQEVHDAPKKAGRAALVSQVLMRSRRQLTKASEEAEALLRLLGEGDWGEEAIRRLGKKLDRIRQQKDDSSHRQDAQERALWEARVGLTEVDESKLSLAVEQLAQIQDAGVAALLALIAEIGNGTTAPRRVVVRGADRRAAFDYAVESNPTTILLDTPFLALGWFEPSQVEGTLGRTLEGQRALEVAGKR